MGILALTADERVKDVRFSEDTLSVELMDGRTISVPLAWYPKLLNASNDQRTHWKLSGAGYGIHWPDIDEDLSSEGLLRGAPAPRKGGAHVKSQTIAKRSMRRSSKGANVYAVRDSSGRFKDIQTYKRAHAPDMKRKSKKEKKIS